MTAFWLIAVDIVALLVGYLFGRATWRGRCPKCDRRAAEGTPDA